MVWLTAAFGLVILLVAGDLLVRGAVNVALRLGIPALIVSLTVVAFGTSAPELLVSTQAVARGAPGLALGNVVGSNTANILLVLGLPAIVSRLHVAQFDTRTSYAYMIAATVVFIAACFLGPIGPLHGLVLLACLGVVLASQARSALHHRRAIEAVEDIEGADPAMRGWKIAVFLVLGLVGLPLGADLLVDSAVEIALRFGVANSVIGLTLVAVGTSLPELATTLMAALRRQADVALGNVIGSNLFNLLAIVGISSFVGPIPVDPAFLSFDLWVMLAASLLLAPFVYTTSRDLTRRWGFLLTSLYATYIVMVVQHG